jgi:hypothetical protein
LPIEPLFSNAQIGNKLLNNLHTVISGQISFYHFFILI